MSKFNKKNVGVGTKPNTVNNSGTQAFLQSDKLALVSHLLTSLVNDQFYRSQSQGISDLKNLLAKVDPIFAAKAAVYARHVFGMRSVSHLVAAELANKVKGENWTKNFYTAVTFRPDDVTEILSAYFSQFGNKLPNSLKKGLSRSFARWDEYQLAKYRQEGKDVSLIDAVNLLHPVPTDNNRAALTKLVNDSLRSTKTWESKVSSAGQNAETEEQKQEQKAQAWAETLPSMGYLAVIRNCRNILEQAPELTDTLVEKLTNIEQIKKSKVFPFQILGAYEQVENGGDANYRSVAKALEDAMEISLANVPDFGKNVCVVYDRSGSMCGKPTTIGGLFAATLARGNNADVILFGSTAHHKNIRLNASLIEIARELNSVDLGGTDYRTWVDRLNKKYDTIIVLSDGEANGGFISANHYYKQYKNKYGASPNLFNFDLQGYGTMQFPESQVYNIAGFSDKVLDIMEKLAIDKNAFLQEVEDLDFNKYLPQFTKVTKAKVTKKKLTHSVTKKKKVLKAKGKKSRRAAK